MPAMAKIAATICGKREEWGRAGEDGGGFSEVMNDTAAHAAAIKTAGALRLRGESTGAPQSAVAATVTSLPGQGAVMM